MPATQQRRVARSSALLALEAVARAAQVLDRLAQLVADVVVGRDAGRERDRLVAVADQLAVQLARGAERLGRRRRAASRRSSPARRTA